MIYGEQKVAKEMKHGQLEKKFYCGLTHLNIGNKKILNHTNYKYKDYEVKHDPEWPAFLNFITATGIKVLDMSQSLGHWKQMELIASAIGNKPFPCTSLKTLNLSRCSITKEGAKVLAPALEKNTSIISLDLSQN